MKIYSRFRRPVVAGLKCPEYSLTEQVYKDQCDLNFLIRKYHLEDDPFALQAMVDPSSRALTFLDTTQVPDIYTALREHTKVKRLFESLDYAIQEKFNFSVDAFADYILHASEKEVNELNIPNLRFAASSTQNVVEPVPEPVQSEEKSQKA